MSSSEAPPLRSILWSVQFAPPLVPNATTFTTGPYTLPPFSIPTPQHIIDLKPTHVRVRDYQCWFVNGTSGTGDTVASSSRYGGAWEILTNFPIEVQPISDYTTSNHMTRYAHFYVMNTIFNQYATTQDITDVSGGNFPDHWCEVYGTLPSSLNLQLTVPSNWQYYGYPSAYGKWTNRLLLEFLY